MGRICARDFKPLGRLLPWVICGLLGCGGDGNHNGPTGPSDGTLEVITSTTGSPVRPDGYFVTVDKDATRSLAPNAADTIAALSPGPHTVGLSGITPNCVLDGENRRTVEIAAGETVSVRFDITCHPVPPGHDIALDANTEIYLLSADGSRFVNLTNDPDDEFDATWSPDGQRIAFTSGHYVPSDPYPEQDFVSHVFVMNADGSGRAQLTHGEKEEGAAWSPDGTRIAYTGTSSDSAYLSVMNADGSGQTQLINVGRKSPFVLGVPAWSPNGTKVAYSRLSSDHQGIIVINADGSGATRLTDASDGGVAWSPDGTKIAFVRTVVGQGDDIYVINPDGSGLAQLTSDPGDSHHTLSWSPDGTKIAFDLDGSIYLVNGNGTGLVQLTFGPRAQLPAWSPDGSKIAYYASDLSWNQLYLMNLDGSGEGPLTPTWGLGRPSSPAAWRP